jgi:hypothetical protein
MIESQVITCPYCGETFETNVDTSGGSQQYTEDCQVCCQPIVFHIKVDHEGGLSDINLRRDDD